jgi:hypothetical protein
MEIAKFGVGPKAGGDVLVEGLAMPSARERVANLVAKSEPD